MFCGSLEGPLPIGYSYFKLQVPCSDSGKPGLQSALGRQLESPRPLAFGMAAFLPARRVPLGNGQGLGSYSDSLSFREMRISERSKRPAGVAIGFSIQVLYLRSPRLCRVDANALLRWPRSRRSSLEPAIPARTRSASTGSQFPGSTGPRLPAAPRLPTAPVPCARAPARGSLVLSPGRDFRAVCGPQGAPASQSRSGRDEPDLCSVAAAVAAAERGGRAQPQPPPRHGG